MKKERYQRFYKNQYVTGDLAVENADFYSYSIMPYIILGAERQGGKILLRSEPFINELRFTKPTEGDGTLIFTDK